MTSARFPIAAALGLVLTGVVFWFLSALINVNLKMIEGKRALKIEFTRMRRDTDVKTIKRQKPELEREQAPSVPQVATFSGIAGADKISVPNAVFGAGLDLRGSLRGTSINLGGSDRDVMPLVRIEPDYPRRASERGVEGWVVVQFTITPAGTVKDAKVVASEPRDIFDSAAVKAVERWKYNPRIENGVAVERRGIHVRLTFQLEKSG